MLSLSPRSCNCHIGDGEERADAGIQAIKADLPIQAVEIMIGDNELAAASIELGSLYCAQKDFGEICKRINVVEASITRIWKQPFYSFSRLRLCFC